MISVVVWDEYKTTFGRAIETMESRFEKSLVYWGALETLNLGSIYLRRKCHFHLPFLFRLKRERRAFLQTRDLCAYAACCS